MKYLEIGHRSPLLVRRERIWALHLGKRVLFASDLHLRKGGSEKVLSTLIEIVRRERPDLILLGGDLVDWRTGLEPLRSLVERMTFFAPVAAIGGNHDRWIGLDQIRKAVLESGGHWLEDAPLRWADNAMAYGTSEQQIQPADCQILCSHDPRPPEARRGFDVVLSGHLHGGQFVFFQHGGRLYPGAFAYRWNGLRFEEGSTTLLVSRGVRDTVPLRWNCPREVISVDL